MDTETKKGNVSVPTAIIVAGVIIAVAIVGVNFIGSGSGSVAQDDGSANQMAAHGDSAQADVQLAAVTEDDHIRGDINAPITVVEFSDIECPFCARFHETMTRVVEEYDGQVAWVYRHFPLANIHPGAERKAEASECVAELSDNETFWEYLDILFAEQTPTGGIGDVAERVGVDVDDFEACLDDGRHTQTVSADLQDAIASGGQGTPHNVIITPDGQQVPVSGAQPYEVMKQVIDTILEAEA